MQTKRSSSTLIALLAIIASADVPAEKGDASFRLEYQYIRTGAFDSSIGDIDIGNTDSHAWLLAFDYAFTNRWTIMASLPYIRKRHTGALPHNPVLDFQNYRPPDLTVVDDGEYHGGFQDIYAGVQYLAIDGPAFSLSPFVVYGTPVRDYPFYAHAAIGRNIWHIPVGAAFTIRPYFSDFFFSGDVAYVFTEKSLGVDISHWLINLNASYYVTPRFAPKIFATIKHGNKGLSFPDDFDVNDLDNEGWYFHDRTIKHNFINAGVGFDWFIGNDYRLSVTAFKMVSPDQVNIVERAWTMGITRYFGPGE
ncbi:MAG: transporter [Planctomycetota bacterium]|nr:transporter [Planctomycetota bacterium]